MKKAFVLTLTLLTFLILLQIKVNASEEVIEGPTIIHKQYDKILTLSQILSLYTSELGDVQVLSDNYVGHGDVPGIYTITLGVSSYQKDISIKVMQTLGDVIAVTDDDVIYVYKDKTLTNNEIISTFINAKQLLIGSNTSVSIITNQYAANPNTPGIYLFEFKLTSTNGSEQTYTTYIKVSPENQLVADVDLILNENKTFVQKYLGYIFLGTIITFITIRKIKKNRKKAYK